MADAYVDLEQTASTASSPYANWGDAAADFQTAMTQAGSGGRVFARIDGNSVGTTRDTAASSRSLNFPGTDQVPFGLYGVKDATTATPPIDSDLCVRGVDVLPVYEATGAGNDITLDELTASAECAYTIQGIRFDAADRILVGVGTTTITTDCEFDGLAFGLSANAEWTLVNCDLEFASTAAEIIGNSVGTMTMIGGLLSGSAPSPFIDAFDELFVTFYGVDLSLVVGTLVDMAGAKNGHVKIVNCKLATGVTRITGVTNTTTAFIEVIGSSDETGLASGEAVRDYAKEWYRGTVLSEATFVRTNGVSDGVASWSFALTPRASSTKESLLSIFTPWFGGVVEGDATTSKDFTIHIANSSGADMTKADAWVELILPSEAGVTQHDIDVSSRTAIDASAGTITDDTASDWSTGAGGKNAQQIIITKTPDYQGVVYARVHFAQTGTNTLYVDPKVYVTDT